MWKVVRRHLFHWWKPMGSVRSRCYDSIRMFINYEDGTVHDFAAMMIFREDVSRWNHAMTFNKYAQFDFWFTIFMIISKGSYTEEANVYSSGLISYYKRKNLVRRDPLFITFLIFNLTYLQYRKNQKCRNYWNISSKNWLAKCALIVVELYDIVIHQTSYHHIWFACFSIRTQNIAWWLFCPKSHDAST